MVHMETRNLRKTRQGVVISNKMDKTIVIAAKFKEKHASVYWAVRSAVMPA